MRGVDKRKGIDFKEIIIMLIVLCITIVVLGFFYGYIYTNTPEYLDVLNQKFAWHQVAPYVGTAFLGFVMLILGIKFKNN